MISLWLKNQDSFGEKHGVSLNHKKDAKGLQDFRSEVNVKKQEKID